MSLLSQRKRLKTGFEMCTSDENSHTIFFERVVIIKLWPRDKSDLQALSSC